MQSCNISVDAKSRTVAVPPQSFDRHRVAGARRRSAESPTVPPYPLPPAIAPVGNDRKLARLTVEGRFCQRCLAKNRGSTGAAPAAEVVAVDPDQVFVHGTCLCVSGSLFGITIQTVMRNLPRNPPGSQVPKVLHRSPPKGQDGVSRCQARHPGRNSTRRGLEFLLMLRSRILLLLWREKTGA